MYGPTQNDSNLIFVGIKDMPKFKGHLCQFVLYSLVFEYNIYILIMPNVYLSGDEPNWGCKRKSCCNGG